MAGHLQALGWGQVGENFLAQMGGPRFQLANLGGNIHIVFFGQLPNLANASF